MGSRWQWQTVSFFSMRTAPLYKCKDIKPFIYLFLDFIEIEILELRTEQSNRKGHFFVFKLHTLPLEILIQSLVLKITTNKKSIARLQVSYTRNKIKHNRIIFSFFTRVFLKLVMPLSSLFYKREIYDPPSPAPTETIRLFTVIVRTQIS